MKKLMSLVLVLALCLTAVAAFAATPSKIVGLINIFVDGQKTTDEPTAAALSASNVELVKMVQNGPALYFGTDVNEVFEFGPVKVTIPQNAVKDGQVEATFVVDTIFGADEGVAILLGTDNGFGLTWNRFDGTANADGAVVATLDVKALEDAEFCALGK